MVLPTGETDAFLQKHQTKNVIIVGIESHVCVLQTTLDLLAKGYEVFVVRDAISSCNRQEVPFALEVSSRFVNMSDVLTVPIHRECVLLVPPSLLLRVLFLSSCVRVRSPYRFTSNF